MKKVTIALNTYNHEKFIRQTIEGILIQDYTDYEVVIADDCSTDNTLSIAKEMLDEFQISYTILENTVNQGANKNFKRLIEKCEGEYIALLDGDDFWIDPEKLKKQVLFLERNPQYALSFTRVRVLKHSNDTELKEYIPLLENDKTEYDYIDVMNDLFMPTSSVVFRNNHFNKLPDWFNDLIILDKPLHLLNLQYGKIKYFPEITTVYRVHKNGIWSINRKKKEVAFLQERLRMLDLLNKELNYIWNDEIKLTKQYVENKLLIAKIKANQINEIDLKKYYLLSKKLNKKDIYIFGTGEAGTNTAKLFDVLKVEYKGFFDNNLSKIGLEIFGKKILNPEYLRSCRSNNKLIVIGSMYYDEISEQLDSYGLKENKDYLHYLKVLNLMEE